jgi:hypothetical protein
MLTLMIDYPFFVANVFVVCWICKDTNPKGQNASRMIKKNVKHLNLFQSSNCLCMICYGVFKVL